MSSEHRLAAIMFTDIVGYTSTMQRSEQEAVRQINLHRDAIDGTVSAHNGETLQYYGDGSLSIFNSAIDAVDCALAIQKILAPDGKVPLRIGLHLGEIYFEGEKFIGDGINIASRIESQAQRGEVLISSSILDIIRNKPHIRSEYLGEKNLKNVQNPIKLYRVESATIADHIGYSTDKKIEKSAIWNTRAKVLAFALVLVAAGVFIQNYYATGNHRFESIAILPFSSLSGDKEHEYFSEGVADEIRSKLASIENLDVKSRSSSAHVKEKNMTAVEIGRALNVNYILEGNVQSNSGGLHVNLSLINAKNDKLVQPIRYESLDLADIFKIQNEVAELVIEFVHIRILPEERKKILKAQTTDYEAHKFYLLGKSYMMKSNSMDDLKKSEEYFRMAIDSDPQYAKAHAGLAEVLIFPAAWGYANINDALPAVRAAALEAVQLDADDAETQQVIGTCYEFSRDFEKAEMAFAKAIILDPTHAMSYLRMSRVKSAMGKNTEAITYSKKFAQLDPFSQGTMSMVPNMLARAGKTEEAVEKSLELLEEFPGNNGVLWQLGLTYACQGEYDKAISALKSRSISTADKNFVLGYAYGMIGDTSEAGQVLDYLLKKNESQYVPPAMIAAVYYGMGDLSHAKEYLLQENNYSFLLLPLYNQLRNTEDFKDIFDLSGY